MIGVPTGLFIPARDTVPGFQQFQARVLKGHLIHGRVVGIQVCGNAQNCVAVCPKEIPLTTSIGRAGRAMTKRAIAKWFDA